MRLQRENGLVLEAALAPIQGEKLGDDQVRKVDYEMTAGLAIDVSLGLGGDSELNLAEPISLREDGKFLDADEIRTRVLEQAHGGGPGGDLVELQKAVLDGYMNDTLKAVDAGDLPAAAEAVYSKAADDPDLIVDAFTLEVPDLGKFFIVDVQNEGGADVYVFDAKGACVLSGWAGESSPLVFSGDGCALPE